MIFRPRVLKCWMFIHSASRAPGTEGATWFSPCGDSQSGSPTKTELSARRKCLPEKRGLRQPLGRVWWWENPDVALWRSLKVVLILLGGIGEGLALEEGQLWPGTALDCLVTLALHLIGVMGFQGRQWVLWSAPWPLFIWCQNWALRGLLGDTGGVSRRSRCRKQLHNPFRQGSLGAPLPLPSLCFP